MPPPISPIIIMPSVSGSFINNSTASFVVVPIIGSPPIPMAVVIPRPAFTTWSAASYVSVPDFETIPILPFLKINPGMIPTFASSAVITPGQFGPINLEFSLQIFFHFHHILYRNTFSDTNYQLNTCIGSFHNCIGCKSRRNKNDTYISACFFYSISNSIKNGSVKMSIAPFARRYTTNYICSVFNHLSSMKSTFGTGKTLYNYFRIFINQNAHQKMFLVKMRKNSS